MDDIDAQVAQLKKRIDDAVKARASAEHQLAVARDRRRQAEEELIREFGVGPEEVPGLVKRLGDDLQAEMARAEEQLVKAEEKS